MTVILKRSSVLTMNIPGVNLYSLDNGYGVR